MTIGTNDERPKLTSHPLRIMGKGVIRKGSLFSFRWDLVEKEEGANQKYIISEPLPFSPNYSTQMRDLARNSNPFISFLIKFLKIQRGCHERNWVPFSREVSLSSPNSLSLFILVILKWERAIRRTESLRICNWNSIRLLWRWWRFDKEKMQVKRRGGNLRCRRAEER